MAGIPAAESAVPEEALAPIVDQRCFLWDANGRAAAMVTLPPGAVRYPPAFAISTPTAPFIWLRYSQRPGAANMYDAG